MANKTWNYTVVFQHPDDMDSTPARRRELFLRADATTANRAGSKAKSLILEEWEMQARDIVILDIYRTPRYNVPADAKDWEEVD